jgi:hypothetical protein
MYGQVQDLTILRVCLQIIMEDGILIRADLLWLGYSKTKSWNCKKSNE